MWRLLSRSIAHGLTLAKALLAGTVISSAVEAKPSQSARRKVAALTPVRVCPSGGTAVKGNGAGNRVVGKYTLYFC
ncbi:MAG: hypothetical protein M3347_01515 [Armatimonadota bacterium]|nr:hypothetical protein [Armatimonadota bacterium]